MVACKLTWQPALEAQRVVRAAAVHAEVHAEELPPSNFQVCTSSSCVYKYTYTGPQPRQAPKVVPLLNASVIVATLPVHTPASASQGFMPARRGTRRAPLLRNSTAVPHHLRVTASSMLAY